MSAPDERPPARTRTFVFSTTHHAMWAEDVAQELYIPAEVVPAPPGDGAQCGLALRTPEAHAGALAEALDQEGIGYTTRSV